MHIPNQLPRWAISWVRTMVPFLAYLAMVFLLYGCGKRPSFVEIEDKNLGVDGNGGTGDGTSPGAEAGGDSGGLDSQAGGSDLDGDLSLISQTFSYSLKVDILWVIDNSGSMSKLQSALRENISSFISQLTNSNLNFQLAITSTDVCPETQPGRLEDEVCPGEFGLPAEGQRGGLVGEGGFRVMKSSDPDTSERFKRSANLGVNGSSFEHGLTAARLAVERAQNGTNEDFMRDQSQLHLVFVSDEEDDGIGLSQPNEEGNNYWEQGLTKYRFGAEDLIGFLRAALPGTHFALSAVVGTLDSNGELCQYSLTGRAYEEGTEYLKAAKLTGGISASICDPSWSDTLLQIASKIENTVGRLVLRTKPKLDSVKVVVNDQGRSDWHYDSQLNAIYFESSAVPAEGSTIKISYQAE